MPAPVYSGVRAHGAWHMMLGKAGMMKSRIKSNAHEGKCVLLF